MAPKIVSIGEVLWDLLPTGPSLGGAPANLASHARELGAETTLVSRVGNDELGRAIVRRLEAAGLPVGTIQVDVHRPTGTVSMELFDGRPEYTIQDAVAWDAIEASGAALAAARRADAVCFGTLAQRADVSRGTIRRLVAATRASALRVFDVNLRQSFYSPEIIDASLALANVVKLNDVELSVLAGMYPLGDGLVEQLWALARRYSLRAIALTRRGRGSVLWADGACAEHSGVTTTVRDPLGAGDAFTAALTIGLLAGRPVDEINGLANDVAAFVALQPGATPPLPESLRRRVRGLKVA